MTNICKIILILLSIVLIVRVWVGTINEVKPAKFDIEHGEIDNFIVINYQNKQPYTNYDVQIICHNKLYNIGNNCLYFLHEQQSNPHEIAEYIAKVKFATFKHSLPFYEQEQLICHETLHIFKMDSK